MRKPSLRFAHFFSIVLCFTLCFPSRVFAYSSFQDITVYSVNNLEEAREAIVTSLNCHSSKILLNLSENMDYYETYELIIPYTRGIGNYATHNFNYVVNGGSWSSLEINVRYYTNVHEEMLLAKALEQSLGKWNVGSDYDKIKAVHDFICENTAYSQKTANKVPGYNYRSAYDAYFAKESVCSGYALLFQKIMEELGIPCYVYIDENEIAHAWNLVYLDGAWYQVDCTWDDAENGYSYDYFLKGAKLDKHTVVCDFPISETDY